jgi:hypothetical protein
MPDPVRLLASFDGKWRDRGGAAALFAGAAALVFAGGLVAGWSMARGRSAERLDACALPAGVELRALGAAERDRVAERAMLCADLEHGRIAAGEYRAHLAALARRPPELAPPLPDVTWAASVRAFSTQYTADSWSAGKVLGPPDAPPGGGDSANAWASTEADTGAEFLEVAFAAPQRMNGVEILESFNPGAVSRVELLLADGGRAVVHDAPGAPAALPQLRRRIDFACTAQPVIGVRVTIDSQRVPGWNEIDAIGGRPCRD